jgi:hypothetical protein
MHIKTEKGLEIELNVEEIRHFKINNAKSLKTFVSELVENEKKIGFHAHKDEPTKK